MAKPPRPLRRATRALLPRLFASVQSQRDYLSSDVRFGERFVDIYEETADGRLSVDYGRLHETERVGEYLA